MYRTQTTPSLFVRPSFLVGFLQWPDSPGRCQSSKYPRGLLHYRFLTPSAADGVTIRCEACNLNHEVRCYDQSQIEGSRLRCWTTSVWTHASLPHSAFLVCLSSRASVFRRPHLLLMASNSLSFSALISGALQHKLTKNREHSYFSANLARVHVRGSAALKLRISSICSAPRWYFFSYCGRTVGNRFSVVLVLGDDEVAGVEGVVATRGARLCSFLRGSDKGRNFNGVW